jgi:hypothetical protein
MQTRSGKIYEKNHDIVIQIKKLEKQLEEKINYNLSHGIYGQMCYMDDQAEIEYLKQLIKR